MKQHGTSFSVNRNRNKGQALSFLMAEWVEPPERLTGRCGWIALLRGGSRVGRIPQLARSPAEAHDEPVSKQPEQRIENEED